MIKNKIHPDPLRAVEFAVWLSAGSTIYLEQMASQGSPSPKAKTYAVGDKKSAVSFVSTNNASDLQRNIYFFPNAEFLDGKRLKENLKAVRHLHVDLDHKDYPGTENEQSDRILSLLLNKKTRPKGIPIPSAVWFTGGGYQAVWMLQMPLEVEEAEELNKAILIALQGGAGTHNADRLLRLPWTMNWLNDSKRAAGRTPAVAFLMEPTRLDLPPKRHSRDQFSVKLPKKMSNLPATTKAIGLASLDVIPLPLPCNLLEILPEDVKWLDVISSGKNPPGKDYGSRSELVFAVVVWMLKNDVVPGHVLSIITDPKFGISAHIIENSNPLRYGLRQIARALAFIETGSGLWPEQNDDGQPKSNGVRNVRYALARLGIDAQL